MSGLRVLDLFSGIGGFSLGLERSGGFETVAFCEIDPFCRRVLAKHWPNVRQYEDVRELTAETLARDGIAVDVICGGFPCQDVSTAGQMAGVREGARSGLWSEFARIIEEVKPRFAIIENVAALRARDVGYVLCDILSIGYHAQWDCIPAAYVGAGHPRDRIWIVAYPASERWQEIHVDVKAPEALAAGQSARSGPKVGRQWEPEPTVGRVVHGLPNRVDRIAALGNAVVPQIPELIGNAILAVLAEQRPAHDL